jgi:hypothetical protein
MRIYSSPVVVLVEQSPASRLTPTPHRERFRICEVPEETLTYSTLFLLPLHGLLMSSAPFRILPLPTLQTGRAAAAPRRELRMGIRH